MLAVSGITITAGRPNLEAAYATPCAWFPADAATTPRALPWTERTLKRAPRTLKAPVFCRFSYLRKTLAPASLEKVALSLTGVT
jgi:hypothetical protein